MNLKLVLNNKNNQGFTLIELMIALVVFTIGLTAALSLAMSNYNYSRDNLDKIIAANLAREGIELIRNVRDSNWLRADLNETCGSGTCTWDYALNGLDPGNNGYVYIDFNDDTPNSSNLVCNIGVSACIAGCARCDLYKNDDGYYINNDNLTGFTLTKYSRVIFLEKICVAEKHISPQDREYTKVMYENCDAGSTYIGVNITSYVEWEDNGTKSIEIVDKLYNWRS